MLFSKSKSHGNDSDIATELNDDIVESENVERINWIKLLKITVEINPTVKPEIIYQNLQIVKRKIVGNDLHFLG